MPNAYQSNDGFHPAGDVVLDAGKKIKDSTGAVVGGAKATTIAQVATANGSDAATTQALANQLKTTVNDLLTNLKAAGIVASS